MSEKYLPLFRKYRPQAFCDLVGQDNLVKALSNAIELNRIAPAYLFCGPRGTGKTSSARIFAKSLNCEHGPTVNPCQKCASCIDITNAAGMDVIEIDAATNRGVEGAEDLIAQVHYAPVGGKYKIFIIDEVHMLTSTAFNALLKTFEEPPENVIFILATTEPHKVLETIVSRCQRFDFRRITVDDIVKRLREISDIENIKIADDALFAIAKNVSGGMRDSLALLDQVSILGAKDEITKEMIEELLGKVTFDKLLELLDYIVSQDIEKALVKIDEIYAQGSEPRNLCENFMEFLRNVIVVLNAKNPHDVIKFSSLSSVDIDKIIEKKYNSKLCERILDIATEYFKEVKFATNPYLWVELMVIRASRAQEQKSESVIYTNSAPAGFKKADTARNDGTEAGNNAGQQTGSKSAPEVSGFKQKAQELRSDPTPDLSAAADKTADQTTAVFSDKEANDFEAPLNDSQIRPEAADTGSNNPANPVEIWSAIVNAIETIPAKAFYSGVAKLVGVEGNKITLGFVNQNLITQAKSDSKYNALESAQNSAFGGKYSFEFVQLSDDIKPLEGAMIKPAAKVQSRQTYAQKPPELSAEAENSTAVQNVQKEQALQTANAANIEQTDSVSGFDNMQNTAMYSPKVKEMLEAFNGKIVE